MCSVVCLSVFLIVVAIYFEYSKYVEEMFGKGPWVEMLLSCCVDKLINYEWTMHAQHYELLKMDGYVPLVHVPRMASLLPCGPPRGIRASRSAAAFPSAWAAQLEGKNFFQMAAMEE